MGLKIYKGEHGLTHELLCDRCRSFTSYDLKAEGMEYREFRRRAGKAGWIRRRGKWLGPCCTRAQRELDLARLARAHAHHPHKEST